MGTRRRSVSSSSRSAHGMPPGQWSSAGRLAANVVGLALLLTSAGCGTIRPHGTSSEFVSDSSGREVARWDHCDRTLRSDG